MDAKNYLRTWREQKGLTVEELARLVATSGANISRIENGKQQPRLGLLRRIVAVFGRDTGDFYEEGSRWSEAEIGMYRIPVIDKESPENKLITLEKPFIAAETDDPEDLFGFFAEDDALGPEVRSGDAVLAKKSLAPDPGDLVIATWGGRVWVRHYQPINGTVFALVATNHSFENIYSDHQKPVIHGTVVEIRRYRSGWFTNLVK